MNGGSSSGIPSNLGILDQIAALHWIQENIQDFGGKDKTFVKKNFSVCAQYGFFIVSQTKCVGDQCLSPARLFQVDNNAQKGLTMCLMCKVLTIFILHLF